MAPDLTTKKNNYESILKTFNNIFDNLISISKEMQKSILTQKWENVTKLANAQEEINMHFNKALLLLEHNNIKLSELTNNEKESEMVSNKFKLRNKISTYKELENMNAKLLGDSLFVAEQKVEKYFNKKIETKTYSKEIKKESDLWKDKPVMLNRLA